MIQWKKGYGVSVYVMRGVQCSPSIFMSVVGLELGSSGLYECVFIHYTISLVQAVSFSDG